jgi:hypothetical protein
VAGRVKRRGALALGGLAAAIALLVWFVTRPESPTRSQPELANTSSAGTQAQSASGDSRAAAREPARKISAAERQRLLDEIRKSYRDRNASPSSGSPSLSAGPAPSLPEVSVDKDFIRMSVRELIPLLSECFQEGLARDPKLQGTIVVDFTIEGEPGVGGVIGESRVDTAASDLKDATVHECVAATMHAIQIAPPPHGGTVRVRYPLAFAPE